MSDETAAEPGGAAKDPKTLALASVLFVLGLGFIIAFQMGEAAVGPIPIHPTVFILTFGGLRGLFWNNPTFGAYLKRLAIETIGWLVIWYGVSLILG